MDQKTLEEWLYNFSKHVYVAVSHGPTFTIHVGISPVTRKRPSF
jgi:hypothetical protein